jgi:hypothetical protein
VCSSQVFTTVAIQIAVVFKGHVTAVFPIRLTVSSVTLMLAATCRCNVSRSSCTAVTIQQRPVLAVSLFIAFFRLPLSVRLIGMRCLPIGQLLLCL